MPECGVTPHLDPPRSSPGITPPIFAKTYPTLHITGELTDGPGPSPSGPVQDRNFGLIVLTVLHRAALQCSGGPRRPVGRRGEVRDVELEAEGPTPDGPEGGGSSPRQPAPDARRMSGYPAPSLSFGCGALHWNKNVRC